MLGFPRPNRETVDVDQIPIAREGAEDRGLFFILNKRGWYATIMLLCDSTFAIVSNLIRIGRLSPATISWAGGDESWIGMP
jgi:hypothetical protein